MTRPFTDFAAALEEPAEAFLHAPRLPDSVVSRTALVNRLRTSSAPIVLVTAPAGYGKTTVLAQWCARDIRPFAWLTLTPGDDHPVTFLRALVGALRRVTSVDD